jgi:enoyl-CoA hydratase/carnithine racemase
VAAAGIEPVVSTPALRITLVDRILHITFDRPQKKNAFNRAGWLELRDAFARARADDAVSVIVLSGAGADFSAGVDLTDFSGDPNERPPFEQMMDELCALDKPLLAAAKGVAVGFGATALFHCDVVHVGESLRLRLPFVSLGLVPEAASSYLLQAIVGSRRAAEIFYTAEWLDASRALEVGIATRIFPDGVLVESTLEKAAEVAQWPMRALRATKRCLKEAHREAIAAARRVEMDGMRQQAGSPENVEAITAFLEKRKPRWPA